MSAVIEDGNVVAPAPAFSRAEDRSLPTAPAASSAGNATSLLVAIERAATNPATDMDKMERLFKMHQQMVAQEAEAAFNAAMARAQAKIMPVANNATNSQTNSKYAKLAAINRDIAPIYAAEGLSVSFNSADCPIEGWKRTVAIVSHAAGHSRQHHIDLPLDNVGAKGSVNKTDVHATGSTSSYARRYLICLIFNVTTEDDDDGNKAGSKEKLLLTEKNVADINALLTEVGGTEKEILAWIHNNGRGDFAKLSEVPADLYQTIVTRIQKARK